MIKNIKVIIFMTICLVEDLFGLDFIWFGFFLFRVLFDLSQKETAHRQSIDWRHTRFAGT